MSRVKFLHVSYAPGQAAEVLQGKADQLEVEGYMVGNFQVVGEGQAILMAFQSVFPKAQEPSEVMEAIAKAARETPMPGEEPVPPPAPEAPKKRGRKGQQ